MPLPPRGGAGSVRDRGRRWSGRQPKVAGDVRGRHRERPHRRAPRGGARKHLHSAARQPPPEDRDRGDDHRRHAAHVAPRGRVGAPLPNRHRAALRLRGRGSSRDRRRRRRPRLEGRDADARPRRASVRDALPANAPSPLHRSRARPDLASARVSSERRGSARSDVVVRGPSRRWRSGSRSAPPALRRLRHARTTARSRCSARPRRGGLARDLVVLIDTSGSMGVSARHRKVAVASCSDRSRDDRSRSRVQRVRRGSGPTPPARRAHARRSRGSEACRRRDRDAHRRPRGDARAEARLPAAGGARHRRVHRRRRRDRAHAVETLDSADALCWRRPAVNRSSRSDGAAGRGVVVADGEIPSAPSRGCSAGRPAPSSPT